MDLDLSGRCTCGAVRYRLGAPPMFVHCCHCRACQRETGSAFAVNALVETSRLEVDGAVEAVATPTESGVAQLVQRCPACKVALWSCYGGRRAVAFVRCGALERPQAIVPDVHIFVRSKLPWVSLPPGAKAFEVYYDVQALWPPESLARRAAALAAGPPG